MAVQRNAPPGWFALLDPVSRRVIHLFILRLVTIGAFSLVPGLLGAMSWRQAAALLSMTSAMSGGFGMMFANVRREPLGADCLNGWDDGFAFLAVSRLAHLVSIL